MKLPPAINGAEVRLDVIIEQLALMTQKLDALLLALATEKGPAQQAPDPLPQKKGRR